MVASALDLSAAFSKFLALQGVARRGTSQENVNKLGPEFQCQVHPFFSNVSKSLTCLIIREP
jgi:hypothetical protein